MRIPLGTSDFSRSVAETPDIQVLNRYFEQDPTNQTDGVNLLCRPAIRKWLTVGDGPIRIVYSQPGSFSEALFVVSGASVYRIDPDETVSNLGTIGSSAGHVRMAATDINLFICDGTGLWVYTEDSAATGTLTASGAIANNDVVEIGGVYYKWTSGAVDTGTPDGTTGNPWLVALGANNTEALSNLKDAINGESTPGTTYSTGLLEHADVVSPTSSATTISIQARFQGADGNAITTTETGANISFAGGTLANGGAESLTEIVTPDGVGIIDVGFIKQFVICVVAQGFDMNGRFYWIDPGEIAIDPLNFATAERSPDPAYNVVVVGDQFWIPSAETNEVWSPTGDPLAPFQPQAGRLFDKGVWPGTVLKIKDDVMAVGSDGTVYRIGAEPVVVSTPGIAQRLREAILTQRAA